MHTCILAFGPYHPDLQNNLDFPASCYENLKSGTMIITRLFDALPLSSLEKFFGFSGDDLTTHLLDPHLFDLEGLDKIFAKSPDDSERYYPDDLRKLMDRNFTFIFFPE